MSPKNVGRIAIIIAIVIGSITLYRVLVNPSHYETTKQDKKDSVALANSHSREVAALRKAENLERSYDSLRNRFDSLVSRNIILEQRDVESIERMRSIENRFKNWSTNDLQKKMIEEYEKAHGRN